MFIKRVNLAVLTLALAILGFASFSDAQEPEPIVIPSSESEPMVNTLAAAHEQYTTIHARIVDVHHTGAQLVQEVWASRPNGLARLETTTYTPDGDIYQQETLIFDGEALHNSNYRGGLAILPVGFEPNETIFRLGGVSTMIAPIDVAERLNKPEVLIAEAGIETITDREATKLFIREPVLTDLQSPGINIWVDVETGIVLQVEHLAPDGRVFSTTFVEFVEFDLSFDNQTDLFFINYDASYPVQIPPIFATPTAGQ